MKKKRFTMLLAGLLLVLMVEAQGSTVPVNVFGDVKIASGGNLKSKGEMFVNANTEASGIVVNKGILDVSGGLTFVANNNRDGMLVGDPTVDGGGIVLPSDPAMVRLKVTGLVATGQDALRPISFPFEVNPAQVNALNPGAVCVWYREYRGDLRANSDETNPANWAWVDEIPGAWAGSDYNPSFNLTPLKGYFFRMDTDSEVTEIIFPATVASLATMYNKTKNIAVVNHEGTSSSNHWGYNCIGSPYTANFFASPGNLGLSSGALYYFDSQSGNYPAVDIEVGSGFRTIPPFRMMFLKMNEWTETLVTYQVSGVSELFPSGYLRSTSSQKADLVMLEISKEDGIPADYVQVFSGIEWFTESYNNRIDAPKMFSSNQKSAEIWIPVKTANLSITGYPYAAYREIPLGVKTGIVNQSYSIALNKSYKSLYGSIVLVDKTLGKVHDLLLSESPYEFLADATRYEDRFILRVSMDPTVFDNTSVNAPNIYTWEGILYVKNIAVNDKICLFDTTGRLIESRISTETELSFPVEKGVYIVRVEGKESSVKKIMVK